jgi:hypothetical protein
VSSSDSFPCSTSRSATAPLNAFAMLAIRQRSPIRIGALVRMSATPWSITTRCLPRCTTAIAPGGPPGRSTSLASDRSSRASARCAGDLAAADAVALATVPVPSASAAAPTTIPTDLDERSSCIQDLRHVFPGVARATPCNEVSARRKPRTRGAGPPRGWS